MWDQVAAEYNAKRSRKWMERDYESLRRKFKNLHMKTKPTGINGDIPSNLRPVVYAKETQAAIEAKGGVASYHDGLDNGNDDIDLVREVDEALGNIEDEDEAEEYSDTSPDDGSEDGEQIAGNGEDLEAELAAASVSLQQSGVQHPTSLGCVVTRRGVFDVFLGEDVWSESDLKHENKDTEPTSSRPFIYDKRAHPPSAPDNVSADDRPPEESGPHNIETPRVDAAAGQARANVAPATSATTLPSKTAGDFECRVK